MLFNKKVFIVKTETVYNEGGVEKRETEMQDIGNSERVAISYIKGFIRGVIEFSKDHPLMKDCYIQAVPRTRDIKGGKICFYRDGNRCDYITYSTTN